MYFLLCMIGRATSNSNSNKPFFLLLFLLLELFCIHELVRHTVFFPTHWAIKDEAHAERSAMSMGAVASPASSMPLLFILDAPR